MEFTLLAAALTGAGAIWVANRLLIDRITVERPTDVLIGAAAVGLLVGRLAAMIGAGVNPLTRPADILIVRGGVSTAFATIGALGVVVWTHRSQLPVALDHLTPGALAGLAGWHGGCLWRGTCLGAATDLPWAMTSPGTAVGRHPVEIYAALGFLAAAIFISRFVDRTWVAVGLGLVAAGGIRLATEPLRLSIVGGPVGWYTAALVLGAAVAVYGQRLTRTRPPGPSSIEI
jgi:prolipoprotein diacylglyceryltransferase